MSVGTAANLPRYACTSTLLVLMTSSHPEFSSTTKFTASLVFLGHKYAQFRKFCRPVLGGNDKESDRLHDFIDRCWALELVVEVPSDVKVVLACITFENKFSLFSKFCIGPFSRRLWMYGSVLRKSTCFQTCVSVRVLQYFVKSLRVFWSTFGTIFENKPVHFQEFTWLGFQTPF